MGFLVGLKARFMDILRWAWVEILERDPILFWLGMDEKRSVLKGGFWGEVWLVGWGVGWGVC